MPEQNERKGSKESEPPDNGKGDSEVSLVLTISESSGHACDAKLIL